MPHRCAVITVSDRAARGQRVDETGPILVAALDDAGFAVMNGGQSDIVPDEFAAVQNSVKRAHGAGARLIVTTGGTGIGPRDRTPEAIDPLLDLRLLALANAISQQPGAPATALLSRAVAGVIGADGPHPTLIVTLPGSKGGVRDGLAVLLPLAHHAIAQLDGGDHNDSNHKATPA